MAIGFGTRHRSGRHRHIKRRAGGIVPLGYEDTDADANPHANEDADAVDHRHYRDANPHEHIDPDATATPTSTPTSTPTPPPAVANFVVTDGSWKFNRSPGAGWQNVAFGDADWGAAVAPSQGLCASGVPAPHIADPMWAPNPVAFETVYFRKVFALDQLPASAIIYTVFDDVGDLYVNGTLVRTDSSPIVDASADVR